MSNGHNSSFLCTSWTGSHSLYFTWLIQILQRAEVGQMWVILFASCCQPQEERFCCCTTWTSEETQFLKNIEPGRPKILRFHTRQRNRGANSRGSSEKQRYWYAGSGLSARAEADWEHSVGKLILWSPSSVSSPSHQAVVPAHHFITRRSSWRGSYTQIIIPSSTAAGETMSPVQVLPGTI